MIIIFNFSALVAAIICLLAGIRLRQNYRETRIKQFEGYSKGFLFTSLAYLFLFFPKLVLFNPVLIQIDFILVDLCFFATVLFFVPSTFSLSEKFSQYEEKSFRIIFFLIIIYVLLNIFFFSSAIPLTENGKLYYWITGNPWVQNIGRFFFICFGAFMLGIFFLFQRKKFKEKIMIERSLLIGLGALIVGIAGIILWFFPYIYFSSKILIFSGLLGVTGFLIGAFAAWFLKIPSENN